MAKVTGKDDFRRRLEQIRQAGKTGDLAPALYAAADIIASDAAVSITAGSVSGKFHVRSKPGEPPKADTLKLSRELGPAITGPLTAEIIAPTPYAVALEFGTSKMAARPFLRPAVKRKKKEAIALIRAAVDKVLRGGKLV